MFSEEIFAGEHGASDGGRRQVLRTRLTGIWERLKSLIEMEAYLWAARIPMSWKCSFALSRFAIPFCGRVRWLGGWFVSDNKLGLLLLPSYLREVKLLQASLLVDGAKPENVLDVGANVGQFAYTYLALAPTSRIVSVEPQPEIAEILRSNLAIFKHRSIVLERAVGPLHGAINMFVVDGKSSQASVYENNAGLGLLGSSLARSFTVVQAPLTVSDIDMLIPSGVCGLIKIDVEGYEREVLEGLELPCPDAVWLEVVGSRAGGLDSSTCINLISEKWNRRTNSRMSMNGNQLFVFSENSRS